MMQRLHAECFENLDTLRSYFSLWAAEVFVTGDSDSELASLACTEAESVEQTNSNNVAAAAAPGVAPLRAPRGRRRRRSTAAASAASSSFAPCHFTYGVWHCATPGCTESGYGLRPAAESSAQQNFAFVEFARAMSRSSRSLRTVTAIMLCNSLSPSAPRASRNDESERPLGFKTR